MCVNNVRVDVCMHGHTLLQSLRASLLSHCANITRDSPNLIVTPVNVVQTSYPITFPILSYYSHVKWKSVTTCCSMASLSILPVLHDIQYNPLLCENMTFSIVAR